MRPKEFVSRVIDLFTFDLGDVWPKARPTSYSAAQSVISMVDASQCTIDVAGYRFVVEATSALGHSVIRAVMFPLSGPEILLTGAVCFTIQEYDVFPEDDGVPLHEHIYESWSVPNHMRNRTEEIVSMLTFLTLKTNYTIRKKTL